MGSAARRFRVTQQRMAAGAFPPGMDASAFGDFTGQDFTGRDSTGGGRPRPPDPKGPVIRGEVIPDRPSDDS